MKTRESGMPEESMWSRFFSPTEILTKLGLEPQCGNVLDVGAGFGTFSVPAAHLVSGQVYAIDIDDEMIRTLASKRALLGLTNLDIAKRDFMLEGFGFPNASVDYVMLFNILHSEDPTFLTHEAFRVLKPGGKLGVIHWQFDEGTPRGPSMSIRPQPENCAEWMQQAGFSVSRVIDLPPYHYGLIGYK